MQCTKPIEITKPSAKVPQNRFAVINDQKLLLQKNKIQESKQLKENKKIH